MERPLMGRLSVSQEIRDGVFGRWTTLAVSPAFEGLMWSILEDADPTSTDPYLQDVAVLSEALRGANRTRAGRTVTLCEHEEATWAILHVLASEAEWREEEARGLIAEAWDTAERAVYLGHVRAARTMAARVAEARRALFEVQP